MFYWLRKSRHLHGRGSQRLPGGVAGDCQEGGHSHTGPPGPGHRPLQGHDLEALVPGRIGSLLQNSKIVGWVACHNRKFISHSLEFGKRRIKAPAHSRFVSARFPVRGQAVLLPGPHAPKEARELCGGLCHKGTNPIPEVLPCDLITSRRTHLGILIWGCHKHPVRTTCLHDPGKDFLTHPQITNYKREVRYLHLNFLKTRNSLSKRL